VSTTYYLQPTAHPNGCRIRQINADGGRACGPFTLVAACGWRTKVPQGIPVDQTTAYQEWLAHTCLTTTRSAS
jgi:hypothetical protein